MIIANVKSNIKGIVAKPAFHSVSTNEFNPAEYNKYINLHLKDYEQFLSSEYSEFVQEQSRLYKLHKFHKITYLKRLCNHFIAIDDDSTGMLNCEQFRVLMRRMREEEAKDLVVG